VLSALRAALKDANALVRVRAAKSLACLVPDNDESVPVLIEALRHPEFDVRESGANTLAALALRGSKESTALGERVAEAVPALVEMLKDVNPKLRYQASWALRHLGSKALAALPALLDVLDDPNHDVRVNAISAFYFMGPLARAAIPALLAIFEDPNGSPRSTAAAALVAIAFAEPGIPDVMVRALNDLDYDVWRFTLTAIDTELAERGLPLLIRALRGTNVESHEQIINAIGSLGGKARLAIPVLRAVATGPLEDLHIAAARALQKIESGA
jgi:HEAT repeat protein